MTPWTAETFRSKHNASLTDNQAEKASKVANAILRDTGDEAKAIKIANSIAKKHAEYRSSRRIKG